MKYQISPRAQEAGVYPIVDLNRRKAGLLERGIRLYDFGVGDDSLSVDTHVHSRFVRELQTSSRYPLSEGNKTLRDAIAEYLGRRFRVDLDPASQILSVTGSKEAIYHLPSLIFEPGLPKDTVIGPNLGYPPYPKGTLMAGAKYHPVQLLPENGFLLELDSLAPEILKKTALAWLNYPHNPTGATCDKEYLARQVETAKRYQIILCSDECYADVYFGDPPPSILQVTTEGVLAFHSLSKRSGLTGWRAGFIAGDSQILAEYRRLRNTIGVATPEPVQLMAELSWSDDHHVAARREVFRNMRATAEKAFRSMNLEYFQSDASFYYWIKAPACNTGESYFEELFQAGIIVTPSEFFDETLFGWFRISLVTTPDELIEALALWQDVHARVTA
ncbi:MAG: aminotransferase class I/II-fold pyridoxal phosphate-dependent enzyme [Bdellovibrionales bacterium]|nr:aminotransferase class I/II-fold pyridoxal phosphate-dependent enzyme [Bdellovibrionales bacterium]